MILVVVTASAIGLSQLLPRVHRHYPSIHPFLNLKLFPTDGVHPHRSNQPPSCSVPFSTPYDLRLANAEKTEPSRRGGSNDTRSDFPLGNYSVEILLTRTSRIILTISYEIQG